MPDRGDYISAADLEVGDVFFYGGEALMVSYRDDSGVLATNEWPITGFFYNVLHAAIDGAWAANRRKEQMGV